MSYSANQMLYTYNWNARVDGDNPNYRGGVDWYELDRTQGYEMIYFIDSCAIAWGWAENDIISRQKLERLIKLHVPSNIRRHKEIKIWCEQNYKPFWDQ